MLEVVAAAAESPYLSVEKTVEQRDEKTLERGKEMRRIGPQGEFDGRTIQRPFDHYQGVGDAQQWQENHGRFNGFPVQMSLGLFELFSELFLIHDLFASLANEDRMTCCLYLNCSASLH